MEVAKTLGWIILLLIGLISVYALVQEGAWEQLTSTQVQTEMIKESISGAITGFSISAVSALAVSDSKEEAMAIGLAGTTAGFVSGLMTGLVYEAVGSPVAVLFIEEETKNNICKQRCFRDYMTEEEKMNCFNQCKASDNITPDILEDGVSNYQYENTQYVVKSDTP